MGVNKLFVFIGAIALMQSTYSAPVKDQSSDDCICTRHYLPVCASDGVTYYNKCLFECAKKRNRELVIKYDGKCDKESQAQEDDVVPVSYGEGDKVCICTRIYDPVCGSDGNTYSNECTFNCAKIIIESLELKYKGSCDKKEEFVPVPYEGEGKNDEDDNCPCPFTMAPVCGSDGITYANECSFNCMKKSIRNLKLVHQGECNEEEQVVPVPYEDKSDDCICSRIYDPICASDGNTYTSECTFNCVKKILGSLALKHKGECDKSEEVVPVPYKEEEVDCVCTRVYAPVCGSNGKTYTNKCAFDCARKNSKSLNLEHLGEC